MTPSTSARNFTPISTAAVSESATTVGTVDGLQMLHGQSLGDSHGVAGRRGLEIGAVVDGPALEGDGALCARRSRRYVHEVVPFARRHDVPPSTDTSTAATMPPPVSVDVPVMVTAWPAGTLAPDDGDVMVDDRCDRVSG